MKKVSVIGIGKLGLCFSLVLERSGYDVVGCDIKEEYVKSINSKKLEIVEPKVKEYLQMSKYFVATTTFSSAISFANMIFVTVRTTSEPDGKYDCSQVDRVVDDIIKLGKAEETKYLVISCNVNPGYSYSVQERLRDYNYKVIYNPEWVAQGSIIHDQLFPDLVVIGGDDANAISQVEEIYKKICMNEPPIHRMDRLSAEMTKVSLNCCLTTKISLANMIGDIAVKAGADPNAILSAIGDDSRIGNKYIKYGWGFGGPCFPRDTRAFIKFAKDMNMKPFIIEAVNKVNEEHHKFKVDRFCNRNFIESPITINGVTYKPGVDIIEESQQLLFAVEIARRGYNVTIRETPEVIKQVRELYGDLFKYEERS